MSTRIARAFRRAGLPLSVCVALALPATASAQATSELENWNLTETRSNWPTAFHISASGDGWAAYRWIDTPNKTTVISANSCVDLANYGQDTIGVNDTNYHNLFNGNAGLCFMLFGRTAIGSGSMVNHDGRVRR